MAKNGFTSNRKQVDAQFERNIAKTLTSLGYKAVENAAKEIGRQPRFGPDAGNAMGAIDTGRLRASISFVTPNKQSGFVEGRVKESRDSDTMSGTAEKNTVMVGTNVEYAPFVELGTVKMTARPFLGNAINNHQDDYKEIVEAIMGEGFGVSGEQSQVSS